MTKGRDRFLDKSSWINYLGFLLLLLRTGAEVNNLTVENSCKCSREMGHPVFNSISTCCQ